MDHFVELTIQKAKKFIKTDFCTRTYHKALIPPSLTMCREIIHFKSLFAKSILNLHKLSDSGYIKARLKVGDSLTTKKFLDEHL